MTANFDNNYDTPPVTVFGPATGGAQLTCRLDRADFHSTVSYGPMGCAHSGGNTQNHTVNPTRPGQSWFGSISGGPINQPGFIAINVGSTFSTPYPLGAVFAGLSPLCTSQMPLTGTMLLSGITSGSESWGSSIPNNNVFGDMHISSQAIFLDFFTPGQVVVSNAADVFTGIRPRSSIVATSGRATTAWRS
ncbi:MAG: hypothetical protein ACI89X_002619 [Planctomycetota bacterium]|jgi:hypothetical protein